MQRRSIRGNAPSGLTGLTKTWQSSGVCGCTATAKQYLPQSTERVSKTIIFNSPTARLTDQCGSFLPQPLQRRSSGP